jgi:hypothetical protein
LVYITNQYKTSKKKYNIIIYYEMPSHRFVDISARGRSKGFSGVSRNAGLLGGAVPMLLKNIIKEPIKGGALQEQGKSNIMVGTVTASVPSPTPTEKITTGNGELLSSISKLKLGKGVKRKEDQNIKFLF